MSIRPATSWVFFRLLESVSSVIDFRFRKFTFVRGQAYPEICSRLESNNAATAATAACATSRSASASIGKMKDRVWLRLRRLLWLCLMLLPLLPVAFRGCRWISRDKARESSRPPKTGLISARCKLPECICNPSDARCTPAAATYYIYLSQLTLNLPVYFTHLHIVNSNRAMQFNILQLRVDLNSFIVYWGHH